MWTRQRSWWCIFVITLITGDRSLLVTCMDSCWEGVDDRTCIINAKFHNINTYDVHIQCTTAENEDRDSGDRFQKVFHAELNGCLTYKNTNPFEMLPKNMNNLRMLTLKEFYIGTMSLDGDSAPSLPKLEQLILKDNVINAYSSDFFMAESIRNLKGIQFAGVQTVTPTLDRLFPITSLRSLILREGNFLLNYESLTHLTNLVNLEIYASNVTVIPFPLLNTTTSSFPFHSLVVEDSHIINSTVEVLDLSRPFAEMTYLKFRNTKSSSGDFTSLNVSNILKSHPQLSSLIVQSQNLTKLTLDLQVLSTSKLQTIDVASNLLEDIDWKWDRRLAKTLIEANKLKIIIDHNPWECEFFMPLEEELFEYEKNYRRINIRGLNCRHNSTKTASNHLSNRPLDLNNMWLLYGCVLSSLLLIISTTYLICAMCRSKRREPFYRSLVKWKSPSRSAVPDLMLRKLPPTNYETPLQYRTIEFKSEDNCEIYEEIPANPTGPTLQVIISK